MTHSATQSPRRVLYLTPLPPPAGGMSAWTQILLERGLPSPWSATVIDTSVGQSRSVFEKAKWSVSEARRNMRILVDLARALYRHPPDLVHLNVAPLAPGILRDLACALVVRLFRIQIVIHYHGPTPGSAVNIARAFQRTVFKALARRASCNIVLNEPSRRDVAAVVRNRQVVLLPNFYDESRLPRARPRRRLNVRPRTVFVGGVTIAKGVPHLIHAARELPSVDFHLIGRLYDDVRPLADSAPQNVVLHGELPHAHVLDILIDSDVFIFPSSSEGFPYAVLEAMAVGLPVIATPVGAIPEMVESGKGGFLIVDPEPRALAAALSYILRDPQTRADMGKFNREKSERLYSYQAVSRRLVSVYSALAEGPRQVRT